MSLVVQMEDLKIVSGFKVGRNGAASGGKNLEAATTGLAIATYTFQDIPGTYSLDLSYFDENDGESDLSIYVNNKLIHSFSLDQNFGSSIANAKSLAIQKIEDIELKQNDVIRFEGKMDDGEKLRLDKLTLNRTGDLPKADKDGVDASDYMVRVEAEDMSFSGFKEKSMGAASGDAYIESKTDKAATLSTSLDGKAGVYDVTLNYFDESDGKSEMSLIVDGQIVETWAWDQKLGSNLANKNTLTSKTFEGVVLNENSEIEFEGYRDGREPLRVDSLDLARVGDLPEVNPEPAPEPVLEVAESELSSKPAEDTSEPKLGPAPKPVEANDEPTFTPPAQEVEDANDPVVVRPPSDLLGDPSEVKAFAGAEGFGADSVGGRGGKVVHVTNLKNSGEGSLRWALEDVSGARTVVFDVEGEIALKDVIEIKNPYVTIAGQTAPGEGVVVTGARIKIETNDVIMRGMKIRPGDARDGENPDNRDSVSIGNGGEDVIIDHNSFTWAIDETVAVWGATNDITISNNIIAESLNDSLHSKGEHGKGLIVGNKAGEENSQNITITKNLFASNQGRNPFLKQAEETEFINNYITNYGSAHQAINLGGGDAKLELAVINNYLEDGQDTNSRESRPAIDLRGLEKGSEIYLLGNDVEGHNKDQTHGKEQYLVGKQSFKGSDADVLDTSDVKNYVLNNVGARVNGELDVVDSRIIREVKNGTTEIIDSQREVGGIGVYNFSGERVKDTDGDGMADWFEKQYAEYGFDYKKADHNGDYDGDGYTNLEEYINGLITGFDFGNVVDTTNVIELVEPKPEQAPEPVVEVAEPKPEPAPEPVVEVVGPKPAPISKPVEDVSEPKLGPAPKPVEEPKLGPAPKPVEKEPDVEVAPPTQEIDDVNDLVIVRPPSQLLGGWWARR